MPHIENISSENIKYFQEKLLDWYKENGRYFPWRKKSASNYELIISEVLLQRTKAETVAKFFPKFLKKFPSWKQLSFASEAELQLALLPIGLFRQRGTRLFKLAQEIKIRNGKFPSSRAEVEDIPMMGQYIANAYELFILKHPSPLLDVNMARVLERYFGKRKLTDIRYDPYIQILAHEVIKHEKTKEINWAILDYGAIICYKNQPNCDKCKLNDRCKYLTFLR
jgi:A/G-specific adenine glycosylase